MADHLELTVEAPAPGKAPMREDSAKRRQVIDGARAVFLADGFDGASMNEIARVAGVSKGTLYVYFASKEELFAALIRDEKRAQAEQMCQFRDDEPDVRAALCAFGVRMMELILRPTSIAHIRIVAAVAGKFPQIGRAFYEAGPQFGQRRLAAFLETQVAAGTLDIEDTATAAIYLGEMCKGPYLLRAILCVGELPTPAEIQAHVSRSVDVFLCAYRPSGR